MQEELKRSDVIATSLEPETECSNALGIAEK